MTMTRYNKARFPYQSPRATSHGCSAGRGLTAASSDFTAGFGLDPLGAKATPTGPAIESILDNVL